MVRKQVFLSFLALVALAVAGCGLNASAGGASATQVTISGDEFKFSPSAVTVKVNQPVHLVFQNTGKVDHELEVEDLPAKNVKLDLSKAGTIPDDEKDEATGDAANGELHGYAAGGGTATLDFIPTKAGTYDFDCNLPGHKEQGMTGTLTVQP